MTADPSESCDPAIMERSERLRAALNFGGGAASIARRIGMPTPTLNNYLAGRDMKASALISLADAAGVSIEWLATGRGDMTGAPTPQIPGFSADDLQSPANFYNFALLLATCQHYFSKIQVTPNLDTALRWVGAVYGSARHRPDAPIELKAQKEAS